MFLLGMAYTDELCSPYELRKLRTGEKLQMSSNTGYITFDNNKLLATTHLTLAHEVEIEIMLDVLLFTDSRSDITLAHFMMETRVLARAATPK